MRIDEEFATLIPPLTDEEYKGLEESILNEGCRDAIVCWNDTLIDGHNRYKICNEHNIPFNVVQKDFNNRDEVLLWIIDNQLSRRNLSAYERTRIALAKEPIIASMAKENQGTRNDICQKSDRSSINTKKEIAQLAGVSHDTVAKVKKIEAEAPEELKQAVRKGDMSINQAYNEIKKAMQKAERQEAISKQLENPRSGSYVDIFTTDKKYRVIYADPAWEYNDKQDTEKLGGAVKHYPTMPLDEICALPVQNLVENNAVLFLWTTSPMLEDAFKVINAWGFKYKSSFIWDKISHSMGHYNSVRHEFLLVCVRGNCTPDVKKLFDSVVSIERTEHSKKPKEFREIIDTLYPIGKRLEMFAREAVEGWDVWGNMA